MAYVYRHIRLDKNEPFYIGIGKSRYRATTKWNRNNLWDKIVSKTDWYVDILFDDVDWDFACKKEKEFIKLYGRININTGILSNMTDGGDGTLGHVKSDEEIEAMRIRGRKQKGHWKGKKMSEEARLRMSISMKGRSGCKNVVHSEEGKKRIGAAAKGNKYSLGRKWSEQSKEKISIANKGRPSPFKGEKRIKLSGERNGMYGKTHSPEVKKILRAVQKMKSVIQYDLNGNFIAEYEAVVDGARAVNGFSSGIMPVCKGLVKQYKGYIWKLKN